MNMLRALAAGATIAVCGFTASTLAEAQPPPPAAQGSVSGVVRNGTQGVSTLDGVRIQLLAIGSDGQVTSQEAGVEGEHFSFTPPADPLVTYVLRATYQGVSYLVDPPVLLSPEFLTEQRDITVYETTAEPPALRIESTVVSVQGLDRAQTQLTLQREDQVTNPADRVYIGGADGVSLRIPVPEGVIEMVETSMIEGEAKLDGGTVTTTQPLKPGDNLVVTRYLVGYDQAKDAYRLRVTAPLPTQRMEIWVPDRFTDDLVPGPDAAKTEDRDLQDERWHVVERKGEATEGEGLIANIAGLSGSSASNPLTQFPGVAIAIVVALMVLLGGVFLAGRVRAPKSDGTPA